MAQLDNGDSRDPFPPGDGVVDIEADVVCPFCGEDVAVALDPGSGSVQQYIEDCGICCMPWQVDVRYDDAGHAHVTVTPLDG